MSAAFRAGTSRPAKSRLLFAEVPVVRQNPVPSVSLPQECYRDLRKPLILRSATVLARDTPSGARLVPPTIIDLSFLVLRSLLHLRSCERQRSLDSRPTGSFGELTGNVLGQ